MTQGWFCTVPSCAYPADVARLPTPSAFTASYFFLGKSRQNRSLNHPALRCASGSLPAHRFRGPRRRGIHAPRRFPAHPWASTPSIGAPLGLLKSRKIKSRSRSRAQFASLLLGEGAHKICMHTVLLILLLILICRDFRREPGAKRRAG